MFNLHGKGSDSMDLEREQIELFLEKCDDVMRSKFIIADTKISELLKSIATSDLLYAFFREITKNFDYAAAQRKYMNYAPEGSLNKRKLLFPSDPAEKLAFIFCLLVDFDTKTYDLGEFLQEYFYEDGSYYESFYAFSNQVIKPFKNLIKTMFKESRLKKIAESELQDARAAELGEDMTDAVLSEREKLFHSSVPDDKKVDGMMILNAMAVAVQKDRKTYYGLLSGYVSFLQTVNYKSAFSEKLTEEYRKIKEERV